LNIEIYFLQIKTKMLQVTYDINNHYEIGIDEAGRGPLFGRLYVSAVVLPKIQTEESEIIPTDKL